MEIIDVRGKQVVILDKKTGTQEYKLKGMLENYFEEKLICKIGIYSFGKLL